MLPLYVDISSTHRDRTQYPSTNNFIVPFGQKISSTALDSPDFVCDSFGYETGTVVAGSSVSEVKLGPSASSRENFYNRSTLQVLSAGEVIYGTVVSYDGATKTATVSPDLSGVPDTDVWIMRRGIPVELGAAVSSSGTTVTLPMTSSAIDDAYKYMYIYTPTLGETKLITAYNGDNRTLIISSPFSVSIAGVAYEILEFSRANNSGLSYFGSQSGRTQSVNYMISLDGLTIPRRVVNNSGGGLVTNYPFLYVEFGSTSSTRNICSNNPKSSGALFKVFMVNKDTLDDFDFVTLRSCMQQVVRYKPTINHKFVIRLPNGEVLDFGDDDLSPNIPNSSLQTSATFKICQVV